jgi:hypothetical protein
MHCVLLLLTLCAAVRDKPVMALTFAHADALFADGVVTRRSVLHGGEEVDPLARAFIGARPTWGRMVPVGAGFVIGEAWLAERMKTSRHAWVRRVWWVPQAVSAQVSLTLAVRN